MRIAMGLLMLLLRVRVGGGAEFAAYCLEKLFKACPIQESLRISSGAVFSLLQEV